MKKTKDYVKKMILGMRKGGHEMNYIHSLRVGSILTDLGFDQDIVTAGYLHDMIEDSDVTYGDLQSKYNNRVVRLVDLCTHDTAIKNNLERRLSMMKRIEHLNNLDAMAIKIVDFADNLGDCDKLSKKAQERFMFKKAPVIFRLCADHFPGTELQKLFVKNYLFMLNYLQ